MAGGIRGGGGGGVIGGGVAPGPRFSGGGGVYQGGGYRHRHRHGGFYPGFAAGAVIGSGLGYYGSSYGYYNDPYYYGDEYADDGVVAVVPGGDTVASCRAKYRSYDVRSQTYLGYDGQRHPCP
jgi:hypothetical protein